MPGHRAVEADWRESLVDPFIQSLTGAGRRLPELMRECAAPLRGEPAFDPADVERIANALRLVPAPAFEHPLLERSVRVGLAHIELTFQGLHPKYGVGSYAQEVHDGFPPTIISAVDALTLWGLTPRAEELFTYWLHTFVGPEGTIRYYGPSLSEYGQLLTSCCRILERGGSQDWLTANSPKLSRVAHWLFSQISPAGNPRLAAGSPEADTAEDRATYFHNNAWIWRGLGDWAWVLDSKLRLHDAASSIRSALKRFRANLVASVRDTWPKESDAWWLRPMAEPDTEGAFERPAGRVTASRLGSYTNYRYWPEMLSSGALPRALQRRIVNARLRGGGQFLGMTRFEDHLDDWPLAEYLEGLWLLGRLRDFRMVLWGHVLFHQAEGHLTAYEQVSFPPGRQIADYCLPCQLVAARAGRRLCGNSRA